MNNIFRPKRLTSYDNESIINEIKRVLSKHFSNRVPSMKDFNKYSMVFSGTIAKRFGSWANAMEKAGFKYDKSPLIISEMNLMNSKMSGGAFCERFGSWTKAIHAFCADRENSDKEDNISKDATIISSDIQLENKVSDNQQIILQKEEVNDYIVMNTSRIPCSQSGNRIADRPHKALYKGRRGPFR